MKQIEIKWNDNVYDSLSSIHELLKDKNLELIVDNREKKDGYRLISLEEIK